MGHDFAGPGVVAVDLHGKNTYQAKVTVDALLRRAGGGTALRDFLETEYREHPKVKRLIRSADGGATELVLREYV